MRPFAAVHESGCGTDVWSGRALQVDFAELAVSGLASMYPASHSSVLCSGPSWISARLRSHYRTGFNEPFVPPVFAGAGKTEPPSRLILSQTSAGKLFRSDYVIAGSSLRGPCGFGME